MSPDHSRIQPPKTVTSPDSPGLVPGDSADRELLGAKVGNIRIIDLLGTGGMGTVFVGVDEVLERRVAVKAIRHDRRLDAGTKARFLREARVLSRLEHPNICRIFDYLEQNGLGHFLVLELVEGETLSTVAERELSRSSKLRIARQIADALVAAHGNGVVHRDLKPSNVMVGPNGEVKVLDFGLSRLVAGHHDDSSTAIDDASPSPPPADDETSGSAGTRLGSVLGTVSYMSPEQANGQPAGPASDMYSFGLVLQELLTGEPAMDPGGTLMERFARAKAADTRPVAGIDGDLAALVNRLKSLNPGARPSAQDTAERLELILDKPKRRARRLVIAAVITALTLLSGALAVQTYRTTVERDRAESEAAKANAINRFVQQALGSAEPFSGAGREITLLEALDGAVGRIDEELGDQPEVAAAVRTTFGATYSGLGRYEEAEPLLTRALETRRRIHGERHPDVATSLHCLGWLRWKQGRLDEAEQLLRSALDLRTSLLGERHPEVLKTLEELGAVLEHRGKFDDAERLARRALDLSVYLYGPNTPEEGASLNDLAWILARKGELDEAERLLRRSLRLRQEGLGEQHPFVALTMSNLASLLMQKEDWEEVEALVRRSLEIRRATLGEGHTTVADSLHMLGILKRHQGELDEAESLFREAAAIKGRAVGENHTDVATHLDLLAAVLADKGELAEAEVVLRRAVDIHRNLGANAQPIFYATAVQNLAWNLMRQGKLDEAEELYREAIDIYATAYAPDHWMIANARANLGACLTKQARYDEAEDLLGPALRTMIATLGEDHPRSQKVTRFLDQLDQARNAPQ